MAQRRVVLIAGPTASGKSALALSRAQKGGGVIINADAMQVYDTLRVVTARPSVEDEAQAEHQLYGVVPAAKRFSTGEYIRAVEVLIQQLDPARELIFVGGTGLYFDALINGFADIPQIPQSVVVSVEDEIAEFDESQRMALLIAEDPETASRLKVADPQRVIRAISVKRATGRALSSYQAAPQSGILAGEEIERYVMWPERDVLRERISHRFDHMFDNGAVDEVKAVLEQNLDPMLPSMKAIGVPEIAAWLRGEIDEEEAIRLATTATHQYAKRQRTWFRNRMGDWPRLGLGGTPL